MEAVQITVTFGLMAEQQRILVVYLPTIIQSLLQINQVVQLRNHSTSQNLQILPSFQQYYPLAVLMARMDKLAFLFRELHLLTFIFGQIVALHKTYPYSALIRIP